MVRSIFLYIDLLHFEDVIIIQYIIYIYDKRSIFLYIDLLSCYINIKSIIYQEYNYTLIIICKISNSFLFVHLELIASFSQLDTNSNSNLSFVEFSHLINNHKVFNTLDRNGDDELTMDELLNSLEYIQNKQKVDKTPPDDTDYDKYEPSQ